MAKNNFVFLRGFLARAPYFDRVPDREKQELKPFLKLLVRVPRDHSQPRVFPDDTIRVVAYGKLAQDTYPLLDPHANAPVNVTGWLQFRIHQGKSVLEVVADEIQREIHAQQDMEHSRTFFRVDQQTTVAQL